MKVNNTQMKSYSNQNDDFGFGEAFENKR